MKKSPIALMVVLVVVAAAVAVFYYFSISLPQLNEQGTLDEETASCAKQARTTFENEAPSGISVNRTYGFSYAITPGDFSDYYNPKSHRCFVIFDYTEISGLGNSHEQKLMDAWSNTEIASCSAELNGSNAVCLNELATSTPAEISAAQFNDIVNQYMNNQAP